MFFCQALFCVTHTDWKLGPQKINSNHPLHIYLQNNKKTFFSKQDVSRVRRATKNIIMIEGCNIFCSSELIIKKPCKLVVNTYISSTSFGKKLAWVLFCRDLDFLLRPFPPLFCCWLRMLKHIFTFATPCTWTTFNNTQLYPINPFSKGWILVFSEIPFSHI